jgi:uncharacterized membrane protein
VEYAEFVRESLQRWLFAVVGSAYITRAALAGQTLFTNKSIEAASTATHHNHQLQIQRKND